MPARARTVGVLALAAASCLLSAPAGAQAARLIDARLETRHGSPRAVVVRWSGPVRPNGVRVAIRDGAGRRLPHVRPRGRRGARRVRLVLRATSATPRTVAHRGRTIAVRGGLRSAPRAARHDPADPAAPALQRVGAQTEPHPQAQPHAPAPTAAATTDGGAEPAPAAEGWNVLEHPIDPMQQLAVGFGDRSHWAQPWRAYLETVPGTALRDAPGINFNVGAAESDAVARLLAESGFRRARVEIPWADIRFDDERSLRDPRAAQAKLGALARHGLRPLILLNSHHGAPCPYRFWDANVIEPAASGDRTVRVDAATAAAIVPGRSGLSSLSSSFKAAEVIFTAVDGAGVARLSKPLPRALAAGRHRAATLAYAPFGAPEAAGGSPNAAFEATLAGWLRYVRTVTALARDTFGPGGFDVEIWNELTFGSDFLYAERYHEALPADLAGRGSVTDAVLARTVAWLRDPANGLGDIGIGNGFANQAPWASGATSPAGLTAIDKHPYHEPESFPADVTDPRQRPLDALGREDGLRQADGSWRDSFVPRYRAYFPEYHLTALQTEHLVRDVSPFTTSLYGTPHGRLTAPAAGRPPEVWVTETGLDTNAAAHDDVTLSAADKRHLQAKATLRALAAFVNKGVTAVDFFAVEGRGFELVDPAFLAAARANPGAYPGHAAGGEVMGAMTRFLEPFASSGSLAATRALELVSIADRHDAKQFEGDGTAAHPPLHDRDVVAFLPFQVSPREWLVPVYVMTRDLAAVRRPDAPAGDPERFDLPEESFRLTVGNVPDGAAVSLTDPLTRSAADVSVVAGGGGRLVVDVPLTDSPRLLRIVAP